MMALTKHILLFLIIIAHNFSVAQTKLQPTFNAQEYIDVLKLEWAHQDSGYVPPSIPNNYKRIYRSPEVGLKNKFDVWLRDDNVAVICIRYTVAGGPSWLENFYSGMIKAKGSLEFNGKKTEYTFSNDDKALVHHGWAIGACAIAPLIADKVNELYQSNVKEFIIVGHSQGAALSYLVRSYLEYLPQNKIPKDVTYKLYCSAAPKPGNIHYAYDFDFITRNGWAYRIINSEDWVPVTPFTTQVIDDLPPINPFSKRKDIFKKRVKKPVVRAYVNHAINDMEGSAKKTNKKYKKYLTKRMNKYVKKNLPDYKTTKVQNTNYYVAAGTPIILKADATYLAKYKYDGLNVFIHHMFETYIYLTEQYYLKQ